MFVQKDGNGDIVGLFTTVQTDFPVVEMADDDSEIVAWHAAQVAEPEPEE